MRTRRHLGTYDHVELGVDVDEAVVRVEHRQRGDSRLDENVDRLGHHVLLVHLRARSYLLLGA